MVFIFQFKSEPLGIKTRRELKENAIPTCLILLYIPKKGEHLLNNCKTKQLKNWWHSTDNTPKMRFTRTQYHIAHFKSESLIPSKVSAPALVIAPQKKT